MASDGSPSSHKCELFVGNLHSNVTEKIIYQHFEQQKHPAEKVHLCLHPVSAKSLGYAYVTFKTESEADSALRDLRFSKLKCDFSRTTLRIMKRQIYFAKGAEKANLFVKNISPEIDAEKLYSEFVKFGNILSCALEQDGNGKHRGYGYVQFEKEKEATEAIANLDGRSLGGKKIMVSVFLNYALRQEILWQNDTRKFTNVYIQNLYNISREIQLHEIGEKFGEVSKHKILPKKGKRLCGLLAFEDSESAKRCIRELDGNLVNGSTVKVEKAKTKQERARELERMYDMMRADLKLKNENTDVYVRNLDWATNELELSDIFNSCGKVVNAKIISRKTFSEDGNEDVEECFGFVAFSTPSEACNAVKKMNRQKIGTKHVEVVLSHRRMLRNIAKT